MTVQEFIARYEPQPARRALANDDEARRLLPSDGLRLLPQAPAPNESWFRPSKYGDPECHLWVIDEHGIPYIFEMAAVVPPLKSGRVTHTNLTGGGRASCGGELWFDAPAASKVYINGCSGRYGPQTHEQLEHAVAVFRSFGYDVVSFGWDTGANRPSTVLL